LMAGLCARAEIDLKKIVALRTLSQLGVMVVALGLEMKELCFFHLMTHALFKALLFLCVGVYIHSTFGGQDYRSFRFQGRGSRGATLPMGLANLSLLGFPFLAGFYRKDLILESMYNSRVRYQGLVWFLVGVGLTTAYSLKIMSLVLPRSGVSAPRCSVAGGIGSAVKAPLSALGVGAALGGAILGGPSSPLVGSGADKIIPLAFIAGGVGLSMAVRELRLGYFSSMWHLTPAVQRAAGLAVAARAAAALDAGPYAAGGGAGLASALLAMRPALTGRLMVGVAA